MLILFSHLVKFAYYYRHCKAFANVFNILEPNQYLWPKNYICMLQSI